MRHPQNFNRNIVKHPDFQQDMKDAGVMIKRGKFVRATKLPN